jgi:hypothetical protein
MRRFIRVDFPTLGFPTMFTKPALCIGEKRVEIEEVEEEECDKYDE